jgi:hypothetical protein
VSLQITYKYLPPGAEPTDDELSQAELVSIRQVEDGETQPRQDVGEVIQVADHRRGDEERSFKVVMVSATPTSDLLVMCATYGWSYDDRKTRPWRPSTQTQTA